MAKLSIRRRLYGRSIPVLHKVADAINKYLENFGEEALFSLLTGRSVGKTIPDTYIEDKISLDEMKELKAASLGDKTQVSMNEGGMVIDHKGMQQITSLDQAIEFFDIDTDKFKIKEFYHGHSSVSMKLKEHEIKRLNDKDKLVYNERPIMIVNYNSKVICVPREKTTAEKYDDLHEYIAKNTVPPVLNKAQVQKCGAGVWGMSDFHLGLDSESNNSYDLALRLEQIAADMNEAGFEDNHVFLGGDFLEIGGEVMHYSQVFETDIALTGCAGIRAFYEMFKRHFIEKLTVNLSSINLVAGNHDRTSRDKNNASPYSSVAETLYWFLHDNLPSVEINYDYQVLSKTIEGVCYILTHGDMIASKDVPVMVQDYGDPHAVYHVLLTGHLHYSKSKTKVIAKRVVIGDKVTVQEEHAAYRQIQMAPFCKPNSYARLIGKSSACAYTFMQRSGRVENIIHSQVPVA